MSRKNSKPGGLKIARSGAAVMTQGSNGKPVRWVPGHKGKDGANHVGRPADRPCVACMAER